MKRTLIIIAFVLVSTFNYGQDRAGTIFYSDVERTETEYNVSIDIYELHNTEHIEVELFNKEEEKLSSTMATLRSRKNKYFLIYNEEEREIAIDSETIDLKLQNPDNTLEYPFVKVKLLDANYQVVDFSKKIFY